MSILSNTAILAGVNVLQTVLFKQGRSIAGVIPNVVVSETHTDELTITNHPVEQGAAITDHAFKNPAQVNVTYGFSDKSALLDATGPGSPQAVYQQLLDIQASRIPFDLITGKRAYSNMLIQSLGTMTDQSTENVLVVTATLKEIITVRTETTQLAPAQFHEKPEKTAPVQNGGTRQLRKRSESVGYTIVNGVVKVFRGPQ